MNNGPQTTASTENVQPQSVLARDFGVAIHGTLFMLFAVELFMMGVVIWYYLINKHSFQVSSASTTDFVWGLITVAAVGWGSWYLTLAHRASLRLNISDSRKLLMIVVASGAILLGVLLLHIAAVFVNKPVYTDIRSQFVSSGGDSEVGNAAAPVGDAANGKKWFGMSCFTCHGPAGDGVASAAPSLRLSEFLKTADDAAIASLIRNGRLANDPANKTGKVMPAKGGNPFLDESKIADLVALLKDLDGQFGASITPANTSTVSTEFSNLPAVLTADAPQLNRWVVPVATANSSPSIWATSTPLDSKTHSNFVLTRDSTRYASVFSCLFVAATSVLALHFLWVIGLGTAVVMHQELQLSSRTQVQLGTQMVLFWSIGAAWLALWFVLFFLIG